MPSCQACGRAFEVRERVGFREVCDGCGADLHTCLNCDFHDTGAHNQCREPQADPVVEKDRANRCEWFRATPEVSRGARADSENAAGKPPSAPHPDPKAALDALFSKKKP